jgi:acetylornithine deacetylase/succinyl-diaminopimelate desuccinylase-like protein
VQAAFRRVDEWRQEILADWREMVEIPAPSGQEAERNAWVADRMQRFGCDQFRTDAKGNLIGTRRGMGGGQAVVFDAHTDAIYKQKMEIKTRMEGGRLYAPGVHDDAAAVIGSLYALRALHEAGIRTRGDLIFAGTVEEEIGVLGGRAFVEESYRSIDWYVFCDGAFGEIKHGQSFGLRWW